MTAADVVILAVILYVGLGLLFSLVFVWMLIGRVDPAAAHAPTGFRLVLLPGSALLWPVLLWKLTTARGGRS